MTKFDYEAYKQGGRQKHPSLSDFEPTEEEEEEEEGKTIYQYFGYGLPPKNVVGRRFVATVEIMKKRREKVTIEKKIEKCLAFLEKHETGTSNAIVKETGLTQDQVIAGLNAALAQKKIVLVGYGRSGSSKSKQRIFKLNRE